MFNAFHLLMPSSYIRDEKIYFQNNTVALYELFYLRVLYIVNFGAFKFNFIIFVLTQQVEY